MASLRFASMAALERATDSRVHVHEAFGGDVAAALRRRGMRSAHPAPSSVPHDLLWEALIERRPDAVREFTGAVPGRKYRLDIAILAVRLAVEVDGWQWHGQHKGDFARDRKRQNLLTLAGWRILRFTAGQIREDTASCVEQILAACRA